MIKHSIFSVAIILFAWAKSLQAQTGPFSPEAWPPVIDHGKKVHYVIGDPSSSFAPPSTTWTDGSLRILTGGDQATEPFNIGGHTGLKVIGNYLNVADSAFREWDDEAAIDILMQVYGDASLFTPDGAPRDFTFLTGTGYELSALAGGSIPVAARNKKWNWVLFRVPNGNRPSGGGRYVGWLPANPPLGSENGGVNNGTIRMNDVPLLLVRLIAFGEQGAFGDTNQINVFAAPEPCDPEPPTNLAFIDIGAAVTNHLFVLNDGDQTVSYQESVGPPDDKRRAVRANGDFMNFGITDNYLGKPCNDPAAMKVCVEYYDDPALRGAVFGPETYATDDMGGLAIFPAERRFTLAGTGKWIKLAFVLPAAALAGVNIGPLTGGPRLVFDSQKVFLSRLELGIFRTGTNSLAGLDPAPAYFEDPNICAGVYGDYVELDLQHGIRNGLEVDHAYGLVEEAGPVQDRRLAVRPAASYLNFTILSQALGPSTQDNARLAVCVTYYDDPQLTNAWFQPELYQSERGGYLVYAFRPNGSPKKLQGTGVWRDAYFEIPDVKFYGLDGVSQAATRFAVSGPVYMTRVRYAVIRPCGANQGVNLLEGCKPTSLVGDTNFPGFLGQDIQAAYQAGLTNITINPGTYMLPGGTDPGSLTFWNLTNCAIVASNVLLSALDPRTVVWFQACENVVFRGATLQYHEPLSTQGTIVAMAPNGDGQFYYELELDPGYPDMDQVADMMKPWQPWGNVFDPVTRLWKPRVWDYVTTAQQQVGPRRWRLFFTGDSLPSGVSIGDWMAFWTQRGTFVFLGQCKNCTLQDITAYGSAGGGFSDHGGIGNHFFNDRITYGPPPPGGTNAPLGTTGNAVHSNGGRVGPHVENCTFEGMIDDGFDIAGALYGTIASVQSNVLTVPQWVVQGNSVGGKSLFAPGDEARISSSNGFFDQATITAVESVTVQGTNCFRLTLDRVVAAQPGYLVSDPDLCSPGYRLINNIIRNNRAHGIFVHGDNGLVRGNRIDASMMTGILLAPAGSYWLWAGYGQHVIIESNTVMNCGYATTDYVAEGIRVGGDGAMGNADILIRNNTISNVSGANIAIEDARDVQVIGNLCVRTHQNAVPYSGSGPDPSSVIWLALCSNVVLRANLVTDMGPFGMSLVATSASAQAVQNRSSGVFLSGIPFTLANQATGLLLRDPDGGGAGTQLVQGPGVGDDGERWILSPQGGGFCAVVCAVNGLVLDAHLPAKTNGPLILKPYTGADGQLWTLAPVDETYDALKNKATGLVATVKAAGGGEKVVLLPFAGGANQDWHVGPAEAESWPLTIDPGKRVHYVTVDPAQPLPSAGANWIAGSLHILTGGDQLTERFNIGGHTGIRVLGDFLNIADFAFQEWADEDVIDVLMQFYGDAAPFNADGTPRAFRFLTGTAGEAAFPVGGSVPVAARNGRWNWILFRVPNGQRSSDGTRLVGSLPPNAPPGSENGGVNGGTIRLETVPLLKTRAVAFGQKGAFGEPDKVNVFEPGPTSAASLKLERTSVGLLLKFTGTVESADRIEGPWTDMLGLSPQVVVPNGNMTFYRTKF